MTYCALLFVKRRVPVSVSLDVPTSFFSFVDFVSVSENHYLFFSEVINELKKSGHDDNDIRVNLWGVHLQFGGEMLTVYISVNDFIGRYFGND